MNLANGEDVMPPAKFVPPNGKAYSMNMVDNVVYTTTGQKCGGNPNGVYSMDLASDDKKVSSFSSNGGGIWGLGGAAIGTDGTVYEEVGDGEWDPAKGVYSDTILALSPKDLKLNDWYTPSNREWITKRDLDMTITINILDQEKEPGPNPCGPGTVRAENPRDFGAHTGCVGRADKDV